MTTPLHHHWPVWFLNFLHYKKIKSFSKGHFHFCFVVVVVVFFFFFGLSWGKQQG